MTQTQIVQLEPNQEALPSKVDREELFISNLATCKTIKDAGIKAGYSESYSSTNLCDKFKKPDFIKKIRTFYNGYSAALLPKILHAESKVVDIVLADPEKISKFRHTLKEIKQSTGILKPDDDVRKPMIQVANIKNLLLNVHDDR